jgi:hypothetical protein
MNSMHHSHAGQDDQQQHFSLGSRFLALAGALTSIVTTLTILARAAGLTVGL